MFCGKPFVSIFRVGDYSFVILIFTATGKSKLTKTVKGYSAVCQFLSPNILFCTNFQYVLEIKNYVTFTQNALNERSLLRHDLYIHVFHLQNY
jgi:hypothetical protein